MALPSGLPDWLALLETRHPKAIQLGLERVSRVWSALGISFDFPVITVAGTNGKGSVCAYLEAILTSAGYRVGLYTSPHILRFNERVRISSQEVDDESLAQALVVVEQVRGDTALTYFEHTTLAAMWLFCRQSLEAVVLEVGLGGRLDAVNLFDADCAVVTPVDLDHIEYLGPDRESIGFEKAGILRRGRPAICGDRNPPESLIKQAEALAVPMLCLGREIEVDRHENDWLCRVVGSVFPALPQPAMVGAYQHENAATAIAALHGLTQQLPVTMAAIRQGVARARLPGRFQIVGTEPLRILDVAHNPHAARALAANLAALPRLGRRLAVLAMLADKDAGAVVDALEAQFDHWHLAGLSGTRGRTSARLADVLRSKGLSISVHDDVATAWQAACQEAKATDTIAAFGSFHTVAEVMALISGKFDG
ncbi:MAG: bifunctional tetrahydrofolate synthase/dihydrofolate synthase [Parasulfuritortus sp.]|jgi:dihydrofolate synthase/folylpolyglutamate synthase|nr:bifunctional tetrahydrofolate synthase/dihydrofolate synthase [Parasulfuritortus sp.]